MNNIHLTPSEVISLGELMNRELLAVFIEDLHDDADHEACARKLKDYKSVCEKLHIVHDLNFTEET